MIVIEYTKNYAGRFVTTMRNEWFHKSDYILLSTHSVLNDVGASDFNILLNDTSIDVNKTTNSGEPRFRLAYSNEIKDAK